MGVLDRMPMEFLRSMDREEMELVLGLPACSFATGSRVIGNGFCVREKTDFDICVLCDRSYLQDLVDGGWECSGDYEGDFSGVQCFVSFRRFRLNVLACVDRKFFDLFRMATDVCRIVGINDRSVRVSVFRRILYGAGDSLVGVSNEEKG